MLAGADAGGSKCWRTKQAEAGRVAFDETTRRVRSAAPCPTEHGTGDRRRYAGRRFKCPEGAGPTLWHRRPDAVCDGITPAAAQRSAEWPAGNTRWVEAKRFPEMFPVKFSVNLPCPPQTSLPPHHLTPHDHRDTIRHSSVPPYAAFISPSSSSEASHLLRPHRANSALCPLVLVGCPCS